jgi:triosephosphate isomerase
MTKLPMIAGNWEMNTTVSEAVKLVKELLPGLEKLKNVEKVVCPPFVSLVPVKEVLSGSSVKLGAQNMYYAEKGAFTGEVSPAMLAELCEYVIIGHSERRHIFGETDSEVNKKVLAALKARLTPILCVGEKLDQNEAGKTEEVITTQMKAGLAGITSFSGLVVAYEPVWAIGTGKAATGEQANGTIGLIRRTLKELYGEKVAAAIRILYGGSVTSANIIEFMKQPEIDGALVGGASLKAADFYSIVSQTAGLDKKFE